MDTHAATGGKQRTRHRNVLLEIGGLPQGYVLATKLDRDFGTRAFDANVARRSLESSLTALGVDRIQLLHLHDPEFARTASEVTGPGGAIDTLFRMKKKASRRRSVSLPAPST